MTKVYCKTCKYLPTSRIFGSTKCGYVIRTWTRHIEATPYNPMTEEKVEEYARPEIHNKYNTCKYYKEGLFYKLFKRWM